MRLRIADPPAKVTLAIALGCALAFQAIAQTTSGQATRAQSAATGLPQAAATTALPDAAATTALPDAAATTDLPSAAATTDLPNAAATTALPDPAATTDLPSAAATTDLPDPAATAALPDPAATTAEPQAAGTATAPGDAPGFFAPSTTLSATVVPGGALLTPDVAAVDTTGADVGSASSASDRSLLDAVVAALSADAALMGTNLGVTVRDGLVTITGTAATQEQAARASDVATGVAGAGRVSAAITPSG